MGKWDGLRTTYQELPEDPKRLDALKAHLDALRDLPLADLAAAHDAADDERKRLEDDASVAGLRRDAARILLADRARNTGQDRLTIGGYNYTPTTDPWPVVKDKTALMDYAREKAPELITYAHGAVKTALKSFLEGDGEQPAGVDIFWKPGLSRTKASSK